MTTGISHLVKEYFQACVSRDPQRISKCLDDDVLWSLGGPVDLLPFCGQRRGKQAVIDTIVGLTPTVMRMTGMDIEELLTDGDRAAAIIRVTAIHAGTGRTVSYRNAHFMRFRDGKMVELRALIDTFDAAEQILGHPINTSLDTPPDIATRGNRIAL
jgi:ketosteroid isomerase-like protein